MKGSLLIPGLVLGFVAAATNASANIVISNLNGNDGFQTQGLNVTRKKGMAFLVDSSSVYRIQSATLRLEVVDETMTPILTLHEDSGSDKPAAVIGTFTNPSSYSLGIANYTFEGSFLVQPSTKYWIQLSGVGASNQRDFDWKGSFPAQTPSGDWSHAGSRFTDDGGQSWANSVILNTYEIKATAVPEPATMAALGLGVLAVVRRRKGA